MIALLAIAAALIPANTIPMVSHAFISRARDRWLLGLLLVGGFWLALIGEWWLALMALWYLIRWRSADQNLNRHLITWVAIGATWGLLRQIPAWAFEWIPYGWMVAATGHIVASVVLAYKYGDPYKRKKLSPRRGGILGSPVITAMFYVLVAPFAPWWFWPILLVGFYLTCSGLALFALMVEFGILYPWTIPISGLIALILGLLLWKPPLVKGERILEWTPRGDSLDGIWTRFYGWGYLLQGWWQVDCAGHDYPNDKPWICGRWLGHGPRRGEPLLKVIGVSRHLDMPNGECHAEPAQHLYEYGVLGLLAGGCFVGRLLYGAAVGDPWIAAGAGGVVLGLLHWPYRHPVLGLTFLTICAGLLR